MRPPLILGFMLLVDLCCGQLHQTGKVKYEYQRKFIDTTVLNGGGNVVISKKKVSKNQRSRGASFKYLGHELATNFRVK